jgi:hypothetical protein
MIWNGNDKILLFAFVEVYELGWAEGNRGEWLFVALVADGYVD